MHAVRYGIIGLSGRNGSILIVGIAASVVWLLWGVIVDFFLLGLAMWIAEVSIMLVFLLVAGIGYGLWYVGSQLFGKNDWRQVRHWHHPESAVLTQPSERRKEVDALTEQRLIKALESIASEMGHIARLLAQISVTLASKKD